MLEEFLQNFVNSCIDTVKPSVFPLLTIMNDLPDDDLSDLNMQENYHNDINTAQKIKYIMTLGTMGDTVTG